MRRSLFLIATLSCGALGAELPDHLPLEAFARTHELAATAADGDAVRLEGGGRSLVLFPGKREARLDGVRVFLAWPVLAAAGRSPVRLHVTDADRILGPALNPTVERSVRPPVHIVLDPGHGGRDDGARSGSGRLLEKDATLALALELRRLLLASGHRVTLTRDSDTFVPLAERAERANAADGDLFLSLHFNIAAGLPKVRGIETYVLTPRHAPSTNDSVVPPEGAEPDPRRAEAFPGNGTDHANALLGFLMHRRLLGELGLPDRGLKRARFAVLRDLRMPGVLIEGAYLSNDTDAALVADPEWIRRLAAGIAAGVGDFAEASGRAAVR